MLGFKREWWQRHLWQLSVVCAAVIWFITLANRALLEPDEGRYAEIAREMLVTGDWVTPRLNGLKYFEKPPLQYWATALSLKLLGHHELAARLWLGLCGFGGVLLAGFTAARLFGRDSGILTGAILVSSLMYLVIGHVNSLDMGLSFFLQLTVSAFVLAQQAPLGSRHERNWMWLSWAAAAAAFLSKGLIALILPSLTLVLYTVVCRDLSPWRRLHIATGLPLLALLCAPWIVLAAQRNPEFLHFFFWHEQFERFLSDAHDRDGPWWYFLPLFALGALPWTPVVLQQFLASWRAESPASFQPRRFLWLWVISVIGFFSLSHSKLPPYIVPLWPMLAMLIGERLSLLPARRLEVHWWTLGVALCALALTVVLLPNTIAGARSVELVIELKPDTALGLAVVGMTLLATAWAIRFRQLSMLGAGLATGCGVVLGFSLLLQGTTALERTRSSRSTASQLQPYVQSDTRFYSVSMYPQSLPFYLQRTMTLVNYRGELDFGLRQQPELGLASMTEFEHAWRQSGHAIAVMPLDDYAQLAERGLPMQIIARQTRWLAVQKPE